MIVNRHKIRTFTCMLNNRPEYRQAEKQPVPKLIEQAEKTAVLYDIHVLTVSRLLLKVRTTHRVQNCTTERAYNTVISVLNAWSVVLKQV